MNTVYLFTEEEYNRFKNDMIDMISHCGATPNKRAKMMQRLNQFDKIAARNDSDVLYEAVDKIHKESKQ